MTSGDSIPIIPTSFLKAARAKTTTEPKAAPPAQENGAAPAAAEPMVLSLPPTSRANVGAETKDVPPEANGRPNWIAESKEETADRNGRANVAAESIREAPAPPAKTSSRAKSTLAPSSQHLLFTIRTLGNLLDDLERVRIMNGNRIGAMEREIGAVHPALWAVQDGLTPKPEDGKSKRKPLGGIELLEYEAAAELCRIWRKHPLRDWANDYPGVGEKLIARLIAEIGDPGERPNPAKLWAYCGLGDPARKRKAGMTQEEAFKLGNPKAKKICWLIGESFVKVNKGPGRERYDAARLKYADRVHEKACIRCGPSGKPALPGSPWSLKHQHEAAKRYAVKQFLKDLWIASRQTIRETQSPPAGAK